MSLAILKKKTNKGGGSTRNDPISGKGKEGFSLNGGYRNKGSVGQFKMVSNTTRTPFRGNVAIGSGGCCGTYVNKPLNSGSANVINPKQIKRSSKNTFGMLETKNLWLHGTYPNYWVQTIGNEENPIHSQSLYIQSLTNKVGGCKTGSTFNSQPEPTVALPCKNQKCVYYIGTRKFIRTPYSKVLNNQAVSQGEYIGLGGLTRKKCLPLPPDQEHFPMSVNNNSCDAYKNPQTWEQAVNQGYLPPDYVG